MRPHPFTLAALLLFGCADDAPRPEGPPRGASSEVGADAAVAPDTAPSDASSDARDAALPCAPLPAPPDAPITPTPGELYYEQVGLGGFALGEAAIVVTGDGRVVLIDVGNDSHADDLAERLEALGVSTLDDVVVTHFHADHGDGVEDVTDAVPMRGRLVHRGTHALTDAANADTAAEVARVAAAAPDRGLALCDEGGCANLGATLAHGATTLRFLGADATMDGERFEDVVGPLDTRDSNGENARSVVGVIEHGAFRLLFTGDLTGGGSGTDDVESFFAPRIGRVSDLGDLGVDVLHAGHHGRDTSSNANWIARLMPGDGRARNVVMGVSTAHLRSPHQEVLDRLGPAVAGGGVWTTRVATGGSRSPELVDADGGRIVVATLTGGEHYIVQAVDRGGRLMTSRVFRSVRGCGE